MLRRLALRLTLATAVVTAVTVTVPAWSEAAGTQYTVNAVNNQFGDSPDQNPLHIQAGDSVIWHIGPGETHTITGDTGNPTDFPGTGPAGLKGPDDFGPVPFDTPGTYHYHCDIHPGMTGEIDVADPPTTTTSSTTTTTEPPTTTTTAPSTTTTRPGTTTTTAPHSTTTTSHATTTTTQPASTASAPPGPTATSGPTPTSGPAPTTGGPGTTTTKPNKDKGNDPTTTTAKHNETAAAAPAPPGDDGFASSIFKPAAAPGADAKAPVDANGAPLPLPEPKPVQHGTLPLLLAGIALVVFGLALVGYKWWTRESRYMPA